MDAFTQFAAGSPQAAAGGDERATIGKIMQEKTMEILINQPRYDKMGRKLEGEITFSRAFEIAQLENPDLALEYREYMKNSLKREKIL